jgi:NAD(P)-dependent dehydrogenase (short-subunit alcohol dehydrogenase family)
VTGAGRGVGREHALLLAAHGAKVVVNDIGAGVDGSGKDSSPASEVVAAIAKAGGEAIANGEDVSSWKGAKAMIDAAIAHFGKLDILINNAGILRDRMLTNMAEDEWDAVIKVHLKGTFAPSRHAAAYWREESKKGNGPVKARKYHLDLGDLRQRRADELRGRQGRHRRLHHHRRARARPLRRHRQCDFALGPDPHDGGAARAERERARRARPQVGFARRGVSGK